MNPNNKMKIYAYREPVASGSRVQLLMRIEDADGNLYLPEPVRYVRTERNSGERIDPFLNLTNDEAQLLADALYEAGIRPTGAAGSAGQLVAVLAHLGDMRAIVASKLGVALDGKAVAS